MGLLLIPHLRQRVQAGEGLDQSKAAPRFGGAGLGPQTSQLQSEAPSHSTGSDAPRAPGTRIFGTPLIPACSPRPSLGSCLLLPLSCPTVWLSQAPSAGYCTGWGDPHYVTFDGLYYSYQGNCTYVLVEEITSKVDNFGVYIDNYHCDVNDQVSCPRTLIVRHESQEVLIKTLQLMPIKVQVRWQGGGHPRSAGPSGGCQGPLNLTCSCSHHPPCPRSLGQKPPS